MRRYQEALELVKKVSEEGGAGESAGAKGGLDVTHLDSALLPHSEKDDLFSIETATAHTKDDSKYRRTAAVFSSSAF